MGSYQNHSPSSMLAMRIRLTDVGERSRDVIYKTIREAEMSKDNLECFFSSAARPGAPALRSVSVVVGKKNPLSSLASALLFQPADSNLVASATLVQRLRQGPGLGRLLLVIVISQFFCFVILKHSPICSFEIVNQVACLLLSQLRVPGTIY